jgi:hypothetical protein
MDEIIRLAGWLAVAFGSVVITAGIMARQERKAEEQSEAYLKTCDMLEQAFKRWEREGDEERRSMLGTVVRGLIHVAREEYTSPKPWLAFLAVPIFVGLAFLFYRTIRQWLSGDPQKGAKAYFHRLYVCDKPDNMHTWTRRKRASSSWRISSRIPSAGSRQPRPSWTSRGI